MESTFKYYACIGKPISHILSPILYNYIFQDIKSNAYYSRLLVNTSTQGIETAKEFGMHGINVTTPFKEDILNDLSSIDAEIKEIGAVNTVTFLGNSAFGFNTDVLGITESFKDRFVDLNNRSVLLLGSGGGARAALYALKGKANKITILNRTLERAKQLAEEFHVNYDSLDNFEKHVKDYDIIISTLSQSANLDYSTLSKYSIIFDANYHKPQRINHYNYISGEEWLINQAIESYRIFTWLNADKKDMIRATHVQRKENKNIILIGFSGSGKTTYAKKLADSLGMEFIDTDDEIERITGHSINEIYELESEYEFRNHELKVIDGLSKVENAVISTGGGAIEFGHTREALQKLGLVVFLYADFETCMKRADKTLRPKLRDDDEAVLNLFKKRKKLYYTTSDMMVNTKYNFDENIKLMVEDFGRTFKK